MSRSVSFVIEMTGSASKIIQMPLPTDDPQQRKPDITEATDKLGWEPKTPLKAGLQHTIAYFDRLLSEQSSTPLLRVAAPR